MIPFRNNNGFLWQNRSYSRRKILLLTLIVSLCVYFYFLLPHPLFHVHYSTIVYDKHGQLLGTRIAADDQWRFPPDSDTLNSKYVTSLVLYEDKRFYRHCGVDLLALGRAIRQNVLRKHVVSGASTITMQTVRLARNRPRTFLEKGIEMIWAFRMECSYNKEEILRMYASHAPFGGNVVGLEAASWRYFNHSSKELSWAEAALLAVLPNAPALIHPGKNNQLLKSKRDQLLTKLKDNHYISEEEWLLSIEEELPTTVYPLPQTAPHLVTYFHLHCPEQTIHSTIDADIQLQVEQAVEHWSRKLASLQIRNIAVIVTDVKNSQVIAYCGNSPLDNISGHVDIIRSPRSSGSILKPFLYAAALQDGDILPHTLLADVPINLNGFSPHNFNYKYDGAVPADQALSRSLNVPMVLLLRKFGIAKFHHVLQSAGFTTLTRSPDDYGLSLILGGGEVTLWELAQAYTAMANAICERPQQKLRLTQQEPQEEWKVPPFTSSSAWFTFDALKQLNRPEEIDWKDIPSMQTIAWKTGTSFGFRDAWAVGATSDYVVAVWVGNATGEGNSYLIGAQTAGPVMFDIFNFLPRSRWFTPPQRDVVQAEVCKISGHLKGRFCPDADTVYICPKGLLSDVCPYHQPVKGTEGETESVFLLPPAWAWYYQQSHPEYAAQSQLTQTNTFHMPMQFIYPTGNFAKVSLPEQWDGSPGSLTVELAHEKNNAVVFWHVDGQYKGTTQYIHKLNLQLNHGTHSVTVVDEEENRLNLTLVVE